MPRNDADRSKERAYMKAYRARNREKLIKQQRDWYAKRRDQIQARKRAWRRANPESQRRYEYKSKLKRDYGLTLDDFGRIAKEQGHRCAICREHVLKLVVDHEHATNVVRGLLCANCNLLLGHAKESLLVLEAAINYLKMTMEKLQGAAGNH